MSITSLLDKKSIVCSVAAAALARVLVLSAHAASTVDIAAGATAADIQSAIDTVDDGGTVRFPVGTWTLDATLVVNRGVTVEGAGAGQTILDFNNACRGFKVSHADAKVSKLRIYHGKGAYVGSTEDGGGVCLNDGEVSDCLIDSCTISSSNYQSGGGGVFMTGGRVLRCEIKGCLTSGTYGHANALFLKGGVADGCDIHNNDGGNGGNVDYNSAVVMLFRGGTFQNSKVHDNVRSNVPGVKIETSGTVRNCLIYNNSTPDMATAYFNGGGIHMKNGGTVEYCTVYGNVLPRSNQAQSGLYCKAGTVKNSIFWGNGPAGWEGGSCEVEGSPTIVNNILDKALDGFDGNKVGDPLFTNAANGDFTISSGDSAACGYAAPLADVTADIVGIARDATAPTCGAYEYCVIAAEPVFTPPSGTAFYPTLDVTLTCETPGATIRYTLDGSEPTEESREYVDPITLSATTTVKARAFGEEMVSSQTVAATYPVSGAAIRVTSSGDAYGTVVPEYGADEAPEVGKEYSFVCTKDIDVLEEGACRAVCTGWKLYENGQVVKSSADAGAEKLSCTCVYRQDQRLTFEWQWRLEYAVTATAPDGQGSVEGGGWIVAGEPVTLTATEASSDWTFARWTGDVPSGRELENPLEIASVTKAMTLDAKFLGNVTLNPGDDVCAYVSTASAGTAFTLTEGTYPLTGTLVIAADVTVKGAGAGQTILDFRNDCQGVNMTAAGGVLEGVTVLNAKAGAHGGGAYLTAGTIRNCCITNCQVTGNYNCGGGVYMTGGTVEGCEIAGCKFGGLYGHGNAVYMDGGTVTDCDIHHNDGGYNHSSLGCGDGIVYVMNGTLSASKIHDNTKDALPGVYQKHGSIVNCLVYNNRGKYHSAGIYKDKNASGTVYHCTVYNCLLEDDTAGNGGLHQESGTTKNCIVWGCAPEGSTAGSVCVKGGTFQNNVTEVAAAGTTDTKTGDPMFIDAENADFRISSASSAYGTGLPLAAVEVDIAGVARDGEHPSIGAYEYDPSCEVFEVKLRLGSRYPQGADIVVEAVVTGAGDETLPVVWTLNGETLATTETSVTLTDVVLGNHTIAAAVTVEGKTASMEAAFVVLPTKVFVSKTGSGTYPYATEETASDSLSAALGALYNTPDVPGEVVIAAGEYALNEGISLMTPVMIRGAGRDLTTIVCAKGIAAFALDNAGAAVEDLTVSGEAHGATLADGRILRCAFSGCAYDNGQNSAIGGGVTVSGGLVADCLFENCKVSGVYCGGAAVGLTGGVVSNCVFRACDCQAMNGHRGGSAYLEGGLLTHCRIEDAKGNYHPAFCVKGAGTVRNCYVTGTQAAKETAMARLENASATVESCTIARNSVGEGRCAVVAADGVFRNNIVWANVGGESTNAIAVAQNCCYPDAVEGVDGNTAKDPQLKSDGRIKSCSPCRNAGVNQPWMEGAVDLNGNPRILNGIVDMGAFEVPDSGLLLMVK